MAEADAAHFLKIQKKAEEFMRLYIIRHGETDLNRQARIQGWINTQLNNNGRKLAVMTGEAWKKKGVKFDLVISSPLDRARETAEICLRESGNNEIPMLFDDRLKEITFGDWEGLCFAKDNYELPTDDFGMFHTDPLALAPFPNGENPRMVCERTAAFYEELINEPNDQDKTILVSLHGCSLRALLNPLYEDPTDFWQGSVPPNCAYTIVDVKDGVSTLMARDVIEYDPSLCINRFKALSR